MTRRDAAVLAAGVGLGIGLVAADPGVAGTGLVFSTLFGTLAIVNPHGVLDP